MIAPRRRGVRKARANFMILGLGTLVQGHLLLNKRANIARNETEDKRFVIVPAELRIGVNDILLSHPLLFPSTI